MSERYILMLDWPKSRRSFWRTMPMTTMMVRPKRRRRVPSNTKGWSAGHQSPSGPLDRKSWMPSGGTRG
eukprot:scaffold139245_cov19-Prasinocladus_malaysianus.AAC.2